MNILNKETAAKRDFGSFHSSNVEQLISQNEENYKPPILDVVFPTAEYSNLALKFGSKELKKTLFYLTDEFCFLNHGAFGVSLKPVVEYVNKWKEYAESQPLRFYDRKIMPLLVDIIRIFARDVFKCKPSQLALVDNCTFAFSSIVNRIKLNPGEKILIFSTTYGVFKKILREKCEESKAILVEELIKFPINTETDLKEKFVGRLKTLLDEDEPSRKIKHIFVDHIPSNQPFLVPVNELAELCKSRRPDILFVVDAAHTLGIQ